ncbi:MAG: hypothetical protein ACYC2U_04705 [Candidatus Amoebophilus sp.]
MPENLAYNIFPLISEADKDENSRPGSLMFEYFQVDVTISINTGDVEVPTALGEVLGMVPLCYSSVFASGDSINNYTTDGVITTGAVTVRVNTTSIADGALTIRGFLVGRKATTVLS